MGDKKEFSLQEITGRITREREHGRQPGNRKPQGLNACFQGRKTERQEVTEVGTGREGTKGACTQWWLMPVIPASERVRQEGLKFKREDAVE